MGFRQVAVKESATDAVAEISWFIESKGLVATAERFVDELYDYFIKLSHTRRSHSILPRS